MQTTEKKVVYRLVEKSSLNFKEGGKKDLTWGYAELDPRYRTRDENGVATVKSISTGDTIHPKTGLKVPILVNGLQFDEGSLILREKSDKHIIDALDESVNNRDFKFRLPDDKVIFYKVDERKERMSSVDEQDLKTDAFMEIEKATAEQVLEYAKAIGGIETFEVEALLSTPKHKKEPSLVKETEEYKHLVREVKAVALKDAGAFLAGFKDSKRPYLAGINEGLSLGVIRYASAEREFSFVLGNSHQTFATCPKGTNDHKNWLAGWFTENESTFLELLSKIKAANALKK